MAFEIAFDAIYKLFDFFLELPVNITFFTKYFLSLTNIFRSGRISSVYIVGGLLLLVTLF